MKLQRSQLSYSTARKSINLCCLTESKAWKCSNMFATRFFTQGAQTLSSTLSINHIQINYTRIYWARTVYIPDVYPCIFLEYREYEGTQCWIMLSHPTYYIYTIKRYGVLHDVCPHQPPSSSPGAINGFPLLFEDYTQSPTPEHSLEHENVNQSH
jgi:hypothetical protein